MKKKASPKQKLALQKSSTDNRALGMTLIIIGVILILAGIIYYLTDNTYTQQLDALVLPENSQQVEAANDKSDIVTTEMVEITK